MVQKFDVGDLSAAAEYFRRFGYVVFRDAIPKAQSDSFWSAVEAAIEGNEHLTYFMYGEFYSGRSVPLDGKKLPRIIDLETHVPEARGLMLSPVVVNFLKHWYGGQAPTCLQTLTYKYSSEQGAHSDKKLVSPEYAHDYDRESLVAAWFALEPSNTDNGALVIYPGSHTVSKASCELEQFEDYGGYVDALDKLCRDHGCEPFAFEADRGDVLFWHGDLVHAGGPIRAVTPEPPTRKSLVCHYASIDARADSRQPSHWRVQANGASYFHKAEFTAGLSRSLLDRLLKRPRARTKTDA